MSTSPFENLPSPLSPSASSTATTTPTPVNPKVESKTEEKQPDELEMLKKQAKIMGIQHSNNISVETLAAKIKEKMESMTAPVTPMGPPPDPSNQQSTVPVKGSSIQEQVTAATRMPTQERRFTRHELKQAVRREQQLEYKKLVRVRITCMNPEKSDLQGEIHTVSNSYLGITSRYVPYNAGPDGWHIENILYLHLKDKKFSKTTVDKKGTPHTKDIPEFSLEVLPPLTEGQLHKLAQRQAMANGTVQE